MDESEKLEFIRPYGLVPNTSITIYEAFYPQPGCVLLTPHEIHSGRTSSWTEQGRNVHAGEGEEYQEHHGVSLPSKPRRPPVDGLGAQDPPGRRIVQPLDLTKPLPPNATPKQRAMWMEAQAEKLLQQSAREERAGVSVRGWRLRALGPPSEIRLHGSDLRTQARLSMLFARIPTGKGKTWLQTSLDKRDPYYWYAARRDPKGKEPAWTPWVSHECIGWLVTEGAKLGLHFAARAIDPPDPTRVLPARSLIEDIVTYIADPASCRVRPPREKSIRSAARILGMNELQPLSAGAGELYEAYRSALRASDDKTDVHEAYHRVLLHRFLRRRRLVPKLVRSSQIGDAAERRANLLQAHRVFVFNSSGCPMRFNQRVLEANGIKADDQLEALAAKNPLLMYDRDPRGQYLVKDWTQWLFEKVLELDPKKCREIFTGHIEGLHALAEAGYLE